MASALVDVERRAEFEQEGAHYESSYFLTFLYLPPPEDAGRAERFLYEGRDRKRRRGCRTKSSADLSTAPSACSGSSRALCPRSGGSMTTETLTYLHSTVSTRRQRVRVPEIPMYLDAVLADQPLIGGLEPMLGDMPICGC